MVERSPEDLCKIKKVECAVLPLVEQKEKLFKKFSVEFKNSFDRASTALSEDLEIIQSEIDPLSKKCPDCPHNSKSMAKRFLNLHK